MSSCSSLDRAPAPLFGGGMGSIPVESGFFSVPRSCPVDQCAFHISLVSYTIFIHLFFQKSLIITHELRIDNS